MENDNGEVVAGVAQVKFRLQSFDVAKKLMSEYMELQYYKEQFKDNCGFDKLIGENRDFRKHQSHEGGRHQRNLAERR